MAGVVQFDLYPVLPKAGVILSEAAFQAKRRISRPRTRICGRSAATETLRSGRLTRKKINSAWITPI